MCVHIWISVNHIWTFIYVCSYMNIFGRKITVYKFRIWTPYVFSTRLQNGRIEITVQPCLQHHKSGYKTRLQLLCIHRCAHIWASIYEQSYMNVHIWVVIYEPYYLGRLTYFEDSDGYDLHTLKIRMITTPISEIMFIYVHIYMCVHICAIICWQSYMTNHICARIS